MIERLAGLAPPLTLLDMGCGTGGHAIRLAERGYHIIGVDRSPAMLNIAREKASHAGVENKIDWVESDIRNLSLAQGCDAAVMMFAVLGYQQTDQDVRDALRSVARHIDRGSPFIFDIWYGPAVLADPPGKRKRVVNTAKGRIVRTTESHMAPELHLCTVHFKVEKFDGDVRTNEASENHIMRYFFPDELRDFAAESGFNCEHIAKFDEISQPANEKSWNAVILFRKQ